MWILFAFGSALFAGLTSILAKCGIRKTDSNVATAIRTIVVLAFAWAMVFLTGAAQQISQIPAKTWVFLILSGAATGASWLCYFRALQLGDVNRVVPIDKSSTILTILLAFLFLREQISVMKLICVALIGAGTYMMIARKEDAAKTEKGSAAWLIYAVLSAVFASLTSILGKIGIEGVNSNLGTAIRTGVVLLMAWIVVFVTGKKDQVKGLDKKELGFIFLSGLATGVSWLCYYKALQDGPASVVVPIDKLSILVTIAFSGIVFHERLGKKALAGLVLIVAGTLLMLTGEGDFIAWLIKIDQNTLLFLQEHVRSDVLTPVFLVITAFGDKGIFWMAVTLLLLLLPKTRKTGAMCATSIALTFLVNNLTLKNLVARIRPYDAMEALLPLGTKPSDFSFPSGHTAISLCVACVLFRRLPKPFGVPFLVLAILIALSRLYLGMHYPSDVLTGAAIGILFSFVAEQLVDRLARSGKKG